MLDLTSYEKALATLGRALEDLKHDPENEHIQSSCIQRFEYCYDFTPKIMRRYFTETEATAPENDVVPFPDLIRLAWERNLLIGEWRDWAKYREARNITSHTYDAVKAEHVLAMIPTFYLEALHFLHQIQEKQAQSND